MILNIVVLLIILFSLFISTLVSIGMLKKQWNKWWAMAAALGINTVILGLATGILYTIDVQAFHKEAVGIVGSLGFVVFIFFLPVITCLNFYIIEFIRGRERKTIRGFL